MRIERALAFILAIVLVGPAAPASAESFVRLIERPFVRYLLTETAEGQEIVSRVLGIRAVEASRPASIRRFAAAMDEETRWARLSGELQGRLTRTEDSLKGLRAEVEANREAGDALGFLRRVARAELSLAEATAAEAASGDLRFIRRTEDSYASLREDFLGGLEIEEGAHASYILEREIDVLSDAVRSLERMRAANYDTLAVVIRGLRSAALETAVQMEVSRAAFAHHRASLRSIGRRLDRVIGRLPSGGDGVHLLSVARQRRAFLDEIDEALTWLPST